MIKIKGVIGWDVIGTSFADMMSRLTGDVDIEIDSPGGYVTDGLSIFNAIKQYKRGKVNIKVVGQASSMAAYIMLAGTSLKFMPNAIVVLHNPYNCACGDYRVMSKNAKLLEKLAALYAEQFVEKGIFSEKEIRSIMDEETWFVGKNDLAKLGEVESSDDESDDDLSQDKDIVIAQAKDRIAQCKAKMNEREMDMQSLERIAALMPCQSPAAAVQMPQTTQQNTSAIQNKKETPMENASELQAKYPKIYAEVFGLGQKAERERVTTLAGFIDDDKDTIVAAIIDGSDITNQAVQGKLLKARMNAQTLASMAQGNADPVDPQEPEHEPEQQQQPAQEQTQEEKEAAEQARVDKIVAFMGI